MTDYPPCACACACACNLLPDTTLLSLIMSIYYYMYYMYPLLNTSLICIPRFPQLSICGGSAVESPTRSRLVCCPLSVVRLASLAHLSFCTCPEKS